MISIRCSSASAAPGVLASLLWDRALGHPIERPGSVTTEWMKPGNEGARLILTYLK